MVFNKNALDNPEEISDGWRDYFSELFNNDIENEIGAEKLNLVKIQNEIIESIEKENLQPIERATVDEVQSSICKMKTGKSPDVNEISSEHFKCARKIKSGTVTPVLKTDKDKMYPENYRGITVTNTFSTVLESLLKDRIEPTLLPKQSKLQRGFTEKASSLNTAFIVTQTTDCYKELLRELFLLTLDAQKAFDKLNHEILFNNLYHDGICGGIWILLRNLYRNMSIQVLAENQHEVQALLDIVENCTKRDLVTINPNKSDLVPITKCQSNFSVYLGKDEITQKSETKHLGLIRNSKNKLNTEDRLKLSRKTLYALLGPGLHARKGMSPIVAYKIWTMYVIPRALYGIEVMNFTESDILKLERLQLKVCRQIQGLPDRTANIATYSLLVVEPVEVVVDRLLLIFLGNLLHNKETLEFKILERQLTFKVLQNAMVKVTLLKLLENELDTLKWKKKPVKKHIIHYWDDKWQKEKQQKSTLKQLNIQSHAIGNAHQKSVPNCHIEVKKAEVKARLLTGTYTLQVNKAKFSNNKETAKCKMCLNDTEDLEHFLLLCDRLEDVRRKHLTTLKCYIENIKKGTYKDLEKDGLLMKLILDSTCESVRTSIHLKRTTILILNK
ncbi:unnamed protein product [Mytilus edulis]|uniref:Reverse transcriptase domain-containing protein n=1 Tax=Mytilus edulis TaxID=6550 RepID=A0A8S3VM14_MYTED|nr:unnamed protein product [Mytilus edulis]